MRLIQLTQGQVAIVSDEDYDELSAFGWCAMWSPSVGSFYAVRQSPRKGGGQTKIYMHRVVTGAKDPKRPVDHINHDTLDNRRENLRIVTTRENTSNQKRKPKCTSQYVGVHWHKAAQKWRAQIRSNGKCLWLGLYATELEAHEAYQAALGAL